MLRLIMLITLKPQQTDQSANRKVTIFLIAKNGKAGGVKPDAGGPTRGSQRRRSYVGVASGPEWVSPSRLRNLGGITPPPPRNLRNSAYSLMSFGAPILSFISHNYFIKIGKSGQKRDEA